jgi:hypothetical protein
MIALLIVLTLLLVMFIPLIGKSLANKDKRDNDLRDQQMIEEIYGPTRHYEKANP